VADAVEDGEEILHRLEREQPLAELAPLQNLRLQHDASGGRRKGQPLAHADLPPRLDQRAPEIFPRLPRRHRLGEQHFNQRARLLLRGGRLRFQVSRPFR
jgi:hypothetical protein